MFCLLGFEDGGRVLLKVKPSRAVLEGSGSWPFEDEPAQGQTLYCLHCGGSFAHGLELVDAADGLLVCPNGDCDGSPMDWSTEPWH